MTKRVLSILITILILLIGGSLIYNRFFKITNYHTAINAADIKEIRIIIKYNEKKIRAKDWAPIIQEFNNSKIIRVNKLDTIGDVNVFFALKDGHSINCEIGGNELKVSRLIEQKKVDYIAENKEIKDIVTSIFGTN
ncbi:hypothetical protein ACPUYX_14645 [Desulfosporosinus sp. SYSU MS00001]|uniref:hypothetical protein n=1 Tax=Desulfosporosinus sp. SYSU MS00001 TaxID=3416284 RepID=UPI003CFAE63D